MDAFVFSSVFGSFMTAGLQCANITVKTVTTFTQSINFVFLVSQISWFLVGHCRHQNCVKILHLGSRSHDENSVDYVL